MAQLRPIGRRAFLALSAGTLLKGQSNKGSNSVFPPQHFLDRATELDLYRLTDPKVSSRMSAPHLHTISRRGRFLVHSSDRTGAPQAYRLDWHTGDSRQLTAAAALDPATLSISSDDRTLFFFDGRVLKQSTMSGLHEHDLAQVEQGWEKAPGFSVSLDGTAAVWVERSSGRSRLRQVMSTHASPVTIAESPETISDPQIRPGRGQVFYRVGDMLHLANLDGSANQVLQLAPDGVSEQILWAPSGETLLYLAIPNDRQQLITLREYTPETTTDRAVSKTSQFGSFGINGDGSVFVGASRNLASPYVLLLVRAVRRELTLCEHRASDSLAVCPVFSPDSQNVFFVSDRGAKSAIYRVHVERFVEETGEEPG